MYICEVCQRDVQEPESICLDCGKKLCTDCEHGKDGKYPICTECV